MSTPVSARDIDAMRHAQHVFVTESDGTAVLTCHLARVLPLRPLLTSVSVPIAAAPRGASPSRGGETLALAIRHARRNRTWAALVNTVRDGDHLEIQWERNGYALLLVLSDGARVDRFSFPATRRTRRTLNETTPRRTGRPARALAALADIASRVPMPRRARTEAASDAAALSAGPDRSDAVPVNVGRDR